MTTDDSFARLFPETSVDSSFRRALMRTAGLPRATRSGVRAVFWAGALLVAGALSGRAEFLVDDSPDTLHLSAVQTGLGNQYGPDFGLTFTGGQFTLAEDATITGASIFSSAGVGRVGSSVFILIFSDPTRAPIEKVSATLDAVDSLYTTTQSDMTRKHASFGSINLAAGTYWFAMPSDLGSGDILQATGDFGDGVMRQGVSALSYAYTGYGRPFLQLEGTAVPEPATWMLLGMGGTLGLFCFGRRRRVGVFGSGTERERSPHSAPTG